jgi:hypothetical protein
MRPRASWLVPALALLAGCELFAYVDRGVLDAGKGGSGGATGASSTAGATGSGGTGVVACVQALDCPGFDTDCRKRTCAAGICGVQLTPEGTPTSAQVSGDCRKTVCDGAGHPHQVEDTGDVLDDHNPCTTDACVAGTPHNAPAPANSACGVGGVCDGTGSCVACVVESQCGGLSCASNHCVPLTCTDQVIDGTETGIDCGGAACGPCDDGKACLAASDCKNGVCAGTPRVCRAPSCSDGVKNGVETDVDCGGTCPTPCAPNKGCKLDADCTGNRCSGSVCLPVCTDGVQDGSETGVDCGGPACAPCSTGGGCVFDGDCFDGLCTQGVCLPATCSDSAKDGTETDVDCGGGCLPCASGKTCATGADCVNKVCAGTLCATPSCGDHTRNGAETDVDCGGATGCARCADGLGCAVGSDCASTVCFAGACVHPSCVDGAKDLAETDVDCGGPACPGCAGGKACAVGTDCLSTVCASGLCTTPTCSDTLQNQGETDADCGGPCPPCGKGFACVLPDDCVTVACAAGICVDPTCSDHTPNGQETGVDCGGPACPKCAGGQACLVASDCASMACVSGVCAATCTDLVQDGAELGIDCGGGTCPGCAAGAPCGAAVDCDSKVCAGGTCAAPACTDHTRNGDESDVDCGGTLCGGCATGQKCNKNTDCLSLGCPAGKCADILLISEVRTHGLLNAGPGMGFGDDFVELYNPGNASVTLSPMWKVQHQSAQGACQAEVDKFVGGNQVIPPHHHFLIAGWEYAQMPAADAPMINSDVTASLADAGSIRLTFSGNTVDAVCFAYDAGSAMTLAGGCTVGYICHGMPVSNLPHDGSSGMTSAVDVSFERKPGGAAGNATDTGDNKSDFQKAVPANPQNLMSPPTP